MDEETRKKYRIKRRAQKEKMIIENSKMKKDADPESKKPLLQNKGKFKAVNLKQLEENLEKEVNSLSDMEIPDEEEERKEFIDILSKDVEMEIRVRDLNISRLISQKMEEISKEITAKKAKSDANVWIANTLGSLIKTQKIIRGEPTEHTKRSISITDMTEEQLNKREAELAKILEQAEDNTIDIEAEPNALPPAFPTIDLDEIFGAKDNVSTKKEEGNEQ